MKVVYKLALALILFFLILPLCRAQVGAGIWPARIGAEVPAFKTSTVEINFFNPSKKNVSLEIEFYCRNCEENLSFFGRKIGEIVYELDVKVFPSSLELEAPDLNQSKKVFVRAFNPLFSKNLFKFKAFGKDIAIPFIAPLFDEKEFDYRILAGIQQGQFKIQITGDVLLKFKGIDKFGFLLVFCIVILVVVIFLKKRIESELSSYEKFS